MRPGIGRERLNALHYRALELELKRLIIGGDTGLEELDEAEVGIHCIQGYLLEADKSPAIRSHIGDRDGLISSEPLLNADIPLQRVRQLQMRRKCGDRVIRVGSVGRDRNV